MASVSRIMPVSGEAYQVGGATPAAATNITFPGPTTQLRINAVTGAVQVSFDAATWFTIAAGARLDLDIRVRQMWVKQGAAGTYEIIAALESRQPESMA